MPEQILRLRTWKEEKLVRTVISTIVFVAAIIIGEFYNQQWLKNISHFYIYLGFFSWVIVYSMFSNSEFRRKVEEGSTQRIENVQKRWPYFTSAFIQCAALAACGWWFSCILWVILQFVLMGAIHIGKRGSYIPTEDEDNEDSGT